MGKGGKSVEVYYDPVADSLLSYSSALGLDGGLMTWIILLSPVCLIGVFYMFVSQSISSIICFSAFIVSFIFIGVSMWILCDILKKDVGPRSM